jgi:hypothetical protein
MDAIGFIDAGECIIDSRRIVDDVKGIANLGGEAGQKVHVEHRGIGAKSKMLVMPAS